MSYTEKSRRVAVNIYAKGGTSSTGTHQVPNLPHRQGLTYSVVVCLIHFFIAIQ